MALALVILSLTSYQAKSPYADKMLLASQKTEAAFSALREERLLRNLPWDSADDPNDTGMIGLPFSGITTTLGPLEAKRSTTNPNVAAMIVKMLMDLAIQKGDLIAINFSSSFPCLNIAVLCAIDALELKSTSVFSIGASTYGANIPEFSYGDMEHFLYQKGLINHKSSHFSYGGDNDAGMEMDKETKIAVAARLKSLGYKQIFIESLEDNIVFRQNLYSQSGNVAAFINVGGNVLSFGVDEWMHTKKSGVINMPLKEGSSNGLVQNFLKEGVPVLQLLNMKDLLPRYSLPIDPVPLPKAGEGAIYQEEEALWWLAGLFLIIALIAILFYKKIFGTNFKK